MKKIEIQELIGECLIDTNYQDPKINEISIMFNLGELANWWYTKNKTITFQEYLCNADYKNEKYEYSKDETIDYNNLPF